MNLQSSTDQNNTLVKLLESVTSVTAFKPKIWRKQGLRASFETLSYASYYHCDTLN